MRPSIFVFAAMQATPFQFYVVITEMKYTHTTNPKETKCDVAIIAVPYRIPSENGNWLAGKAEMTAILVCGRYPHTRGGGMKAPLSPK